MADLTYLRRAATAVLWPGFLGTTVPPWLARALDDGLPGVVLFGQNIDPHDPERVRELTRSLHAWGPHVMVASDEEGGTVTRLDQRLGSPLPSHAQLGRIDDTARTREVGVALGTRCTEVGIDVVLGPVADVNTDPRNPVIGVRSFGGDPALVARHVTAMVQGLHAAGARACAKHFPGHGDTVVDSHVGSPVFRGSLQDLQTVHLPPFRAAIAAGVDALMTAHLTVPPLGAGPATLSARVAELAREEGFTGVIVTDALDMAAISATVGPGEGAVAALRAGADLLCVGNPANPGRVAGSDEEDFLRMREAITDAVLAGRLPLSRLQEAGARVAALGHRCGGIRGRAGRHDRDFRPLVREVLARTAQDVQPVGGGPVRAVLDLRPRPTMAVEHRPPHLLDALARAGLERVALIRSAADLPREGGIVLCDDLHEGGEQRDALRGVLAHAPGSLVVNLGLPAVLPEGVLAITTLGDSRVTADVVAELVAGSR
ncbi:glycoside hydrolase family 3 protein [Serinibacter salmoneus]|uniref:Beta-N-acetylhexosaminidase n=1 Tax=Serinibacter salmoneus TaxID=556530 RepID=A0A2A9D288_9MICO|nr:glycoside hydrolase family 3 N-terminal domain-containing protein [Serinibacter salmoneus]PFG20062.1 beta-N-acetylhexosaminidase [Serinibacter salmoneus]